MRINGITLSDYLKPKSTGKHGTVTNCAFVILRGRIMKIFYEKADSYG